MVPKSPLRFNIPFAQRLMLFVCITVVCFLIGSLATGALIYFKGATPSTMYISAVLQDLLVFILPAIVTAMLITRLPARFLAVTAKPTLPQWILPCAVLVLSVPAMNALVAWNESIRLPEGLAAVEEWMRAAEQQASQSIGLLLGGDSILAVIVSILVVGILAGFSEELFFRGTMQRLFSTAGMNRHVAIWIVAFVFSATHLQFYGFFGRLLLGAYFGYLLYWTRCLWVPVIVHVFNNTLYIIGLKIAGTDDAADINRMGADNVPAIIISIILVIAGIHLIRRICFKNAADDCTNH